MLSPENFNVIEKDPDNFLIWEAEKSLAKLGSTSTKTLIPLLTNQDTKLREIASDILAEIQDRRSIKALSKALLEDESPRVRRDAAFGLV